MIHQEYATSMRNLTKDLCQYVNFNRYIFRSTYVPLEADMNLKRDISRTDIKSVLDRRFVDQDGNYFHEMNFHISKT